MMLDEPQLYTACRLFNEGCPESKETSRRIVSFIARCCDNFSEVVAVVKSRPRRPVGEIRFDAQDKCWITLE